MIGALIPAIGAIGSALFGRGKGNDGNEQTQKLLQSLLNESRPLLTQSIQRQQQMSPLYDAVLRMVAGQLPSWAGLDLGAMLQQKQPQQTATPRRSLQMSGNQLGVR